MTHRARGGATCVVAALVALAACRPTSDTRQQLPPLRDASRVGVLQHPLLVEASGVVRSTVRDNVFWSQNDSGNDPDVFAYDSTGKSLGVAHVLGATDRDWEAIALGPCAAGSCLYIGDVGDNHARYPSVTIWRVTEPVPGDTITTPAVALRFRYPQGPRDVEAMWVAPDTSIWLVSKRPSFAPGGTSRPAQLYHLSADAWATTGELVATLVDSLPIVPLASEEKGWITDAALSPADSSGRRHLAVRTYKRVYIFAANPATGRPGALEHVCALDQLYERQGEGVTWMSDGRLLFNSEGRAAPLLAGRCP